MIRSPRSRPRPSLGWMGALIGLMVLGGAGCKNSTSPGPHRAPRAFFVPTDITLAEAPDVVIAGDTLWITQSPFLPLTQTLEFRSDQTPLLIRGTKSYPAVSVSLDSTAIFRFVNPRAGTRVEHLLFSGGTNSVEATGQGTLTINDCLFRYGAIQVLGNGSGRGLRVELSQCLMTDAARFSVNLVGNATLAAKQNTIIGAGDCGVLLESSARGDIRGTLVYDSANYGIACETSATLADSAGCNDIFQSGKAHYLNCTEPDSDFHADPLFCDPAGGDYTLFETSPCAEDNSGGCGTVGARGPACAQ
jgi:hypothetical protein